MPEQRIEQLFLVPGNTKAEVATWGAAVLEFAAYFPGVYISHDYADALRPDFERLTVVEPDSWPDDLWTMIKQNPRHLIVEKLTAPTPEVLAEILHVRVYYGLRFGFQTEYDWAQQWAPGVSLIGLHGRSDGNLQGVDYDIVQKARIEAIKLTSHAEPSTLERLRAINPGLFIMVRPILNFNNDGSALTIGPQEFFDSTANDLQRLFDYDPAIQYIEVHNEPNLVIEGLSGWWSDGKEFGTWFDEVVRLYKGRWPDKKYGFPGLSPGNSMNRIRQNMRQFLGEAALAAARADWIAVHGYWVNDREMTEPIHGFTWQLYREFFPDKLLFITEFGNPAQPKPLVAEQYSRYYGILRHLPGLGGAISYVVSTSNAFESPRWAWRDENGLDMGIAAEVGLRKYIR